MSLPLTITASVLSGGLAGACVSAAFNRLFHWRELRTKFFPILSNMYGADVIRMENPGRRYWKTIVGMMPAREDEEFIDHRATFIADLVQFNELREVRALRKAILDNHASGNHVPGTETVLDLAPELEALNKCSNTVHQKLKLWT